MPKTKSDNPHAPEIRFGGEAGCYSLADMIMSKEEQISCVLQYQKTGDACLKTKIIGSVLNYIIDIARQYVKYSKVPLKDLVQEGVIGTMMAMDKYDVDKSNNASFLSYASWWIKNRISRYSFRYQYVVSPPISHIGGRDRNGVSRRSLIKGELSLNAVCGEEGGGEFLDVIPAQDDDSGMASDLDLQNLALAILGKMSGRDAKIVKMRFGLLGEPPMTLDAVSRRTGLTRERVRQIVNNKLADIRRKL